MNAHDSMANDWTAITTHATNKIPCNGVYVGGAGDVKVISEHGSTATFTAVPAGTFLPIYGNVVFHTDSTATLMVALNSK